jgi:hypothetical protein
MTGTVGFTTTNEVWCATVAVTGGTATLLVAELLTCTRNVSALTRWTGSAATLFELPCDDAVKNISPRFDPENVIGEFNIARLFRVEGLNGDFHVQPS